MGGRGSGRPKRCPHCDEVLRCLECGARFTPEAEPKVKTKVSLTTATRAKVDRAAKKLGVTRSKFMEMLARGEVDPP